MALAQPTHPAAAGLPHGAAHQGEGAGGQRGGGQDAGGLRPGEASCWAAWLAGCWLDPPSWMGGQEAEGKPGQGPAGSCAACARAAGCWTHRPALSVGRPALAATPAPSRRHDCWLPARRCACSACSTARPTARTACRAATRPAPARSSRRWRPRSSRGSAPGARGRLVSPAGPCSCCSPASMPAGAAAANLHPAGTLHPCSECRRRRAAVAAAGGGPAELPYELRALEVALHAAAVHFDESVSGAAAFTLPALDRLTARVGSLPAACVRGCQRRLRSRLSCWAPTPASARPRCTHTAWRRCVRPSGGCRSCGGGWRRWRGRWRTRWRTRATCRWVLGWAGLGWAGCLGMRLQCVEGGGWQGARVEGGRSLGGMPDGLFTVDPQPAFDRRRTCTWAGAPSWSAWQQRATAAATSAATSRPGTASRCRWGLVRLLAQQRSSSGRGRAGVQRRPRQQRWRWRGCPRRAAALLQAPRSSWRGSCQRTRPPQRPWRLPRLRPRCARAPAPAAPPWPSTSTRALRTCWRRTTCRWSAAQPRPAARLGTARRA
jgi:hypothetical protein